ncbi:glutamine amidotransferase [Janthinobacterium sp.]|uniref:glutamine amidotransferase n=1 Tax=Janthinobacterium sp. TaxID=1871054 RepID=UPI00293D55DA|nr:glutamine amidotransferase [Janthinobacterium sp.]
MSLPAPAKKRAAVIRFLQFEDLGTLSDVLSERGYAARYYDAGVDALAPLLEAPPELLVVLGGPIGAYQEELYPCLREVLGLLAARAAADAPTLLICLGAQLLARALGARVYAGAHKELGWAPLTLTPAGLASPLRHLDGPEASMLHWHGDTFDLPAGAVLLASTGAYRNQAYSHGRLLAFQCHPELRAAHFERWLIGHACEIAHTPGADVGALRAATLRHGAALEAAAHAMFGEWLDGLG